MSDVPSIVSFDTDISAAEKPENLPVGKYPATVVTSEYRQSKSSGNTRWHIDFSIDPADYPATYPVEEAPDGTTVSLNNLVVENTKKSLWRVKSMFETLGAKPPKKRELTNEDLQAVVGQRAMIEVRHGSFEGEERIELGRVEKLV